MSAMSEVGRSCSCFSETGLPGVGTGKNIHKRDCQHGQVLHVDRPGHPGSKSKFSACLLTLPDSRDDLKAELK